MKFKVVIGDEYTMKIPNIFWFFSSLFIQYKQIQFLYALANTGKNGKLAFGIFFWV